MEKNDDGNDMPFAFVCASDCVTATNMSFPKTRVTRTFGDRKTPPSRRRRVANSPRGTGARMANSGDIGVALHGGLFCLCSK